MGEGEVEMRSAPKTSSLRKFRSCFIGTALSISIAISLTAQAMDEQEGRHRPRSETAVPTSDSCTPRILALATHQLEYLATWTLAWRDAQTARDLISFGQYYFLSRQGL